MHTQNQTSRCLGSLLLKSRSGSRQWPPPALTKQVLTQQVPTEPSIVTSLTKRQQGQPLWRTSRRDAQIVCLLLIGWFAQPPFANADRVVSGDQYLDAAIDAPQQPSSMTATTVSSITTTHSRSATETPRTISRTESHASWQSLLASLCLLLAGALAIARKILK